MPTQNLTIFFAISALLISFMISENSHGEAEMNQKEWKNLLFPKGSPTADVVDVVDLRTASSDTKLTAITLQGQINEGDRAKIYLLLREQDIFWLDWMKQKGYIKETNNLSIEEYIARYTKDTKSVVIYDPELPSTINIATMIASLNQGIVISPKNMSEYSDNKSVSDLRGRWASNIDAYNWALENLWQDMNHNILACLQPDFIPHHLRDYLISNKVFTFWITGKDKKDGIKSDYSKEREFAEKLFGISPTNIPVIGFWGSGGDDGITEYAGVGLAGEYGKISVPCDWTTNMSFLSGVDVDFSALVDNYQKSLFNRQLTLDDSKIYISFDIVESGDAPVYWQGVQHGVWQDMKRGQIPIGWSLGPSAIELIPPIMAWFYENATPNDHFIMAMSGAGYVHPYRNFMSKVDDPDSAWQAYLGMTQQYMDFLNLNDIYLYTDAWREFDRDRHDPITMKFVNNLNGLDNLILGMGRDEVITEKSPNYLMGKNNVLVSHIFTRWDTQNVRHRLENRQWLINEIRQNTPKYHPAFMHVHALSWGYYPSDLVAILDELGEEYLAVTPKEMKQLYMKYVSGK
ncbi:hypothetical protein FJZ33_01495 [Candidatus Poribacteria bacterium]|nr:hypothetical protein [Candidatus Poribacteria bacterium]